MDLQVLAASHLWCWQSGGRGKEGGALPFAGKRCGLVSFRGAFPCRWLFSTAAASPSRRKPRGRSSPSPAHTKPRCGAGARAGSPKQMVQLHAQPAPWPEAGSRLLPTRQIIPRQQLHTMLFVHPLEEKSSSALGHPSNWSQQRGFCWKGASSSALKILFIIPVPLSLRQRGLLFWPARNTQAFCSRTKTPVLATVSISA